MTDSERLDLSSASSAWRRRMCRGSENLIRLRRDKRDLEKREPDPDAQSGIRVHRAWAGEAVALSESEARTLAEVVRMEKLVLADWARDEPIVLLGREHRLWLHEGLEPVHSGQMDCAYLTADDERMLILDAKTLYGQILGAPVNDQLRELVALARFNYPQVAEFTVGLLAPNLNQRPSLAVYDQFEAELALRLLRHTLAECADPDAVRTPGAWCKYCRAISHCEEARMLVGQAYNVAKRIEQGEFTLPTGDKGTRFLDSVLEAQTILEAIRVAYKGLLEREPQAVPGWHLRDGKEVREIVDVLAAWELAQAAGVPLEKFLASVKLVIGPLEAELGKKRFSELLGPVINWRTYAPELARITEAKKPKKLTS